MENNNSQKEKDPDILRLEKQVRELSEMIDPFKMAPRIIDIAIKGRGDKTGYVSGGNTIECDVVLDIEWQGRRYRLPAFEL